MNISYSDNLPVNKLVSVFGSTSATYKFHWLIALIELVEEGNVEIAKRKIKFKVQLYGSSDEILKFLSE
jgi:hypothetical protein